MNLLKVLVVCGLIAFAATEGHAQRPAGSVFSVASSQPQKPDSVTPDESYVSLWLADSKIYSEAADADDFWKWMKNILANDRAVANVNSLIIRGNGERIVGATNIQDIVSEAAGNGKSKRRFNVRGLDLGSLQVLRPYPVRRGDVSKVRLGFYGALIKDKFVADYVGVINGIVGLAGYPQLGAAAKPEIVADLYENASRALFGEDSQNGKVFAYAGDDNAYAGLLRQSGFLVLSPHLSAADASSLRVVTDNLNRRRLHYFSNGKVGARVDDKTFALIEVRVQKSRVAGELNADWRSLSTVAARYDQIVTRASVGDADAKAIQGEIKEFRKWLPAEASRELTLNDMQTLNANLTSEAVKGICYAASLSSTPECSTANLATLAAAATRAATLPVDGQVKEIAALDAALSTVSVRKDLLAASKQLEILDVVKPAQTQLMSLEILRTSPDALSALGSRQ